MIEKMARESVERAIQAKKENDHHLFLETFMDFKYEHDEEEEKVIVYAPVTELMYNPIGVLHGGITTFIADTAMGRLCAIFGKPSVTLELKTQFFKAVKEGTIKATAYFVRKGKTVQFVECTLEDEKGNLIGKVSATFYTIG